MLHEYTIDQPVVIFNPRKKHYIIVTFFADGSISCSKTGEFTQDCLLSLGEAVTPLNMLVAHDYLDETLQLLKVNLIEGEFFVQHVKGK